jgi:hypothetical protein
MKTILLGLAAAFALGVGGLAEALPISSCVFTTSLTCNIYESDAQGNPSDVSNMVSIPVSVVSGFIVVLETGGTLANPSTWSDVVEIFNNVSSTTGNLLQLFSGDGSFGASFIMLVLDSPHVTIFENPLGTATTNPSVYTAGGSVYNIFSAPSVPEPATLALLGIGLAGIGFSRRRKLH